MEEAVFMVSEVWLVPTRLDHFRRYMARVTELLRQHGVEYAYHGHPFEWVSDPAGDELPTGIQVLKFQSEAQARAAMALLGDPELSAEGRQVFKKTRTYLSRVEARQELIGSFVE